MRKNKYSRAIYNIFAIVFIIFTFVNTGFAKEKDTILNFNYPSVNILGDQAHIVKITPGTVNLITTEQIYFTQPFSGNEVFRSIPGINISDEEGAGLRLNLGIRGLNPDRSRSLLVLEDGVPVSLAPYGEPELYYTPSIDRMSSIEILKGSGSIIHGPQTIGGVVNYITHDPPQETERSVKLTGGGGGYLNSKIGYGTTVGSTGFLAELYHKRADKIGLTNYNIYDFMTKAKFTLGSRSSLRMKLGVYDENSNSTYVGITQSMYDDREYFTEISPNDNLNIRRYSASLAFRHLVNAKTVFNTTMYGYQTSRFWRRQDFSRTEPTNSSGVVFGDTEIDGGAIYMRNSTGNRDREFEVIGIQPGIVSEFDMFNIKNELNTGVRMHWERALEQRINGSNPKAVSGALVDEESRTGVAFAAYLQNRMFLTDNLTITPGIRYENFNYEREIIRTRSIDTLIKSNSTTNSLIPGFGLNYNFKKDFTVFMGVHRGFAPPRIKDAITNAGTSLELDAELSWNYELGIRKSLSKYFSFEATAYQLSFSNQIIPVSESSGGPGTGLVNGGETLHRGVELSLLLDITQIMNIPGYLALQLSSSFNKSEFTSDRFIENGDEFINIKGNVLPYAPEYNLSAGLNYRSTYGVSFNITTTYIGEQFSDELNTILPTNDGLTGIISSYFLTDATVHYKLKNANLGVFFAIKNLFDERFIASRRPQGIKVGIPRFITMGIDFTI